MQKRLVDLKAENADLEPAIKGMKEALVKLIKEKKDYEAECKTLTSTMGQITAHLDARAVNEELLKKTESYVDSLFKKQ